jgi:formate C-acetyltransferase
VTVQTVEIETRSLWGRFEELRDHLFGQYQETVFDPGTGLSLAALEAEVAAYLQAHREQPRVLQKAHVMRIVLTQGQIAIDPEDWFVDKVNYGCPVRSLRCESRPDQGGIVRRLSLRWLKDAIAGPIAQEATWLARARRLGQATGPKGGLDRGHIAPGWDDLLSSGLTGLLERVASAREALGERASREQLDFYEAVEIVYNAAIVLAGRFRRLAAEMAEALPGHRERLYLIASAMSNVPAHRPRTFHEALQFMWLMHELIEMEGEFVRSMGQFDRTLYPYYRADIEAGRLTREQAKELIKFFWFKWYARTQGRENGKNFCFGGQYADGTEITNELTFLALEAHEELATPDPKLSVRLGPTSPERLYRLVAELIRTGQHSFVLLNDPVAVEALVKRGKSLEDARVYLPIGCYEPAVEGKEAGCTMNITVNLAKGVELALNDGQDPLSGEQIGPHTGDPRAFDSFDQMWDAYVAQMDYFLEHALAGIQAAERAWPQINPSPMVAGTFEHCIARGKDIGQGGPLYNGVGFVGAALANTCDSLLALRKAVYEEKRFTAQEVLEALRSDFEGRETMRQYLLNRVPKWGNNDPEADDLAKRIAGYFCNKVHSFTNGRGGVCSAALFSLNAALTMGQLTGALPDGRKAWESLAPGQGAAYGRDRNGVTALIDSVTKLDSTLTPNGAVLDVTLHPSAVAGEEGLEALTALIKTFLAQGGYAVQFNVFDVHTLKEAQRHPERYATLQIRVTGWSVYFTCLSKLQQDQYIARITHSCRN